MFIRNKHQSCSTLDTCSCAITWSRRPSTVCHLFWERLHIDLLLSHVHGLCLDFLRHRWSLFCRALWRGDVLRRVNDALIVEALTCKTLYYHESNTIFTFVCESLRVIKKKHVASFVICLCPELLVKRSQEARLIFYKQAVRTPTPNSIF